MMWERLMGLFCKVFGHAPVWDMEGRYCVRCGRTWAKVVEENTSDATTSSWDWRSKGR